MPVSSGSVYVLAAVKSAVVRVPVNAPPVPADCGLMANESEPDVDDEKVALLVVVKVAAIEPEVEVRLSAPVVRVKPFEAVSVAAEVMVPEPVVDMLLDVEIVLAVAIVPKPEAMEPDARAPVVVIVLCPT